VELFVFGAGAAFECCIVVVWLVVVGCRRVAASCIPAVAVLELPAAMEQAFVGVGQPVVVLERQTFVVAVLLVREPESVMQADQFVTTLVVQSLREERLATR
jgi:hypothetical protein